ncbi:small G protein signaling modulator 3-like isoform X2 [Babylonia areolata]
MGVTEASTPHSPSPPTGETSTGDMSMGGEGDTPFLPTPLHPSALTAASARRVDICRGGEERDLMRRMRMREETRSSESSVTASTRGRAFSAVLPSMWPPHVVASKTIGDRDSASTQLDHTYDEFGFTMDGKRNPRQQPENAPTAGEESRQRQQQWTTLVLEFNATQRKQPSSERTCSSLCWRCSRAFTKHQHHHSQAADSPSLPLPSWSEKLQELVRQGIPHSLRPQVWLMLSGAWQRKVVTGSSVSYSNLVSLATSSPRHSTVCRQIEEDLPRTMPTNACFSQEEGTGVVRLRRVLRALAVRFPDTGYCQGAGVIVGCLLLFLEEEDVFWMMCAITEDLLPEAYHSSTLTGAQVDQRVLRHLVVSCLPATDRLLRTHDVELSVITLQWFLTLFAGVVHMGVLLRLWDVLFCSGSHVLFHFALGLLSMKEDEVKKMDNSAEIFSTLSALPGTVTDVEDLMDRVFRVSGSLTSAVVSTERGKYLTYLQASQRTVWRPEFSGDRPPQQHSSLLLPQWPWRWPWRWRWGRRGVKEEREEEEEVEEEEEGVRGGDGREREVVAELYEAITLLADHCQPVHPGTGTAEKRRSVQADYSVVSHARDLETYIEQYCHRRHRRLCHRHRKTVTWQPDEEGGAHDDFKNDEISPVSSTEEQCVAEGCGGQVGMRRGLPSTCNLAEMRDEAISDLVTDRLCPAVQAVFSHGLKKSKLIGGDRHPWLFIEEVAGRQAEKDRQNGSCRLMLCQTYRLDEDDGKVPTPEELLHLAVKAINTSHHLCQAPMDLKFQSLLCCGLNEHVLHLWLECLCCCSAVVTRWYRPWALLRSGPAWVRLKCHLRLLNCVSFRQLSGNRVAGAPSCRRPAHSLPQDTARAQHLFNWDF